MANKFCTSCGAAITNLTSRFCVGCGAPLGGSAATPAHPPAAPAGHPDHMPGAPTTPFHVAPAVNPMPVLPLPVQPAPRNVHAASTSSVASTASSIFGKVLGAVEDLAPLAAAVASATGNRELASELNLAASAARTVSDLFNVIKTPNGKSVVIGGYTRSVADADDVPYDGHNAIDPANLPRGVDLRPHCSDIEEQGELGSCTANAMAGAIEYLELRGGMPQATNVSRLFIYYLEREIEGTIDEDAGAMLRNGIKAMQQYGVCAEAAWPYEVDRFTERPSARAYQEAKSHMITEAQRVPIDVHAWKSCLAEGYPIAFGTDIFSSFEEEGTHGNIDMPGSGEKNLGGHAMLCVGYDDGAKVFVVRNSWGADWGDGGYCYFPYDYLCNEEYTDEAWTIRNGQIKF
jgi:C1A family cysteine protease